MKNRVFLTVDGGKIMHFCFTPALLPMGDMNTLIRYWAAQDFGITSIKTEEDVKHLKATIIENFKKEFPEITVTPHYDRHGYCRLWLNRHLSQIDYEVHRR